MSNRRLLVLVPSLVLVSLAAACGGSVEPVPSANPGPGSSGGASSSGASGTAQCTAAPACDPGDTSFASSSEACIELAGVSCYQQTLCGATVWCQHREPVDNCAAYPSCPQGYIEVKGCVPDSDCTTATACGHTIICQRDERSCLAPRPLCDDGDTEVGSSSGCRQDDARCYSRSNGCGYTIWCTGPAK